MTDPYGELDYAAHAEAIGRNQIDIPQTETDIQRPRNDDGTFKFLFSFKKLWAFTGPGFLM